MIGHEHVFVADLFVGPNGLKHVDIPLVREDFDKVADPPADVSEVDVENLVALSEVPDHVVDLFARAVEHLGHRALAEVQAVVLVLVHRDELLEALDGPQHAVHAHVAIGCARVVRMAGQPDPVLRGDGHHALKEVVDPLPELVGGDLAGDGQGLVRVGLRVTPC